MEIKINKQLARKVLSIVDHGLVKGLGEPEKGKMCIEAAVCFALGLPHSDNPPCVGKQVRNFKISLNDCSWSSDEARTKGMRKLAIAQLGSDFVDQKKFLELVGFDCITKILPVIVKNALKEDRNNKFVKERKDAEKLKPLLEKLESAKTFDEAKVIAKEVWDVYASASASVYAYAYAYAYASAYAYAYASAYASVYAYAYASASASVYAYAYASAKKNLVFNDQILNMTAQAGLDALIKLKSPGTKYLDLCEVQVVNGKKTHE